MALGIIISPAKKMNVVEGPPYPTGLPSHMDKTRLLFERLRQLSLDEARQLWSCSDRLAAFNYDRLHERELEDDLTAACLAYEGIQYQHLAASVMSDAALAYLEQHLRILSGFYGVVRPCDGVIPYRLEMQARLSMPAREGRDETSDLYSFWSDELARTLATDFDTVVNVASVEYAKAVVPYLPQLDVRVITCLFGFLREKDGRFTQRSTEAKAARGTFVRWCAENGITQADDLGAFGERGYRLDEGRSTADTLVFVK